MTPFHSIYLVFFVQQLLIVTIYVEVVESVLVICWEQSNLILVTIGLIIRVD